MKMKFIKYSIIIALSVCIGKLYGQNVGINTDDPKTSLDIRGNLKLQPDEIIGQSELSPLYRVSDSNTQAGMHEIVQKKKNNENDKPYYEFNLSIPLSDYTSKVNKFATNIPADRYILSVVNSNLVQDVDGNPVGVEHLTKATSGSDHVTGNPLKQVDAWIENGKWYISAQYRSAYSVTATGGRHWIITLLAMDTQYAQIVDPNPNYTPDRISGEVAGQSDPFKAITKGDYQEGRHYDRYDPNNPQNPSSGEPQSLRGDSFKLDNNMTGSAKVDPLRNFENR